MSLAESLEPNPAIYRELQHALDAGRMVAWDLDIATGVSNRSENAARIFGIDTGSAEDFYALVHPDDRARVEALRNAALRGEADYDAEFRLVTADGRQIWVEDRARVERDGGGQPSRMIGIVADITARKAAELAAVEAAGQFTDLADNISQLVWMAEADGSIFWYNKRWYDYTGTDLAAMQGWGWREVHHPDHIDRVIAEVQGKWAAGEPWEGTYLLRSAGGQYRWFLTRAEPIRSADGSLVRWFGTNTDITAQREAEEALRRSDAYVRLLLDSTAEGFYAVNRDGVTTVCNPAFLKMLGFAREEDAVGRKLHDVIHHSHPDGTHYLVGDCPIYVCARDGTLAHVTDELFYRLDGTPLPVEYWAHPILRDGELDGAICTFFDITERKQAEARQLLFLSLADRLRGLSEPREIVAAAVEVLGRHLRVCRVGFGEVSDDGETFLFETDYADDVAHLVGSFPGNTFGRGNIAELRRGLTTTYADVTSDPRTSDADFAAIETRSAMAVPLIREGRLRAALYLNHRDVREWTPDEVALVQDIAARTWDALERARAEAELRELNATLERRVEERTAELQLAEAALRQAQKMEAVGQLTGGIAHDFNNMLAVILGSLDLLGRHTGAADARARRYVDAATDGARRAALLTQRLLAFSRQQPLQPEPVDLNKLVAGMSDLLRHSLGAGVRLETVLAGGLWRAHADPNQLENAVINLAVNGRDAMPEGGRLTIETQNAHLDARYAAAELGVPAGQYVLVAVTDSGSGMPADVVAKAFDPFFTTKEVGKGTGLGLSQVYGFVKQSGGHVKIYSESGQGTTVKVYLPRLVSQDHEAPVGKADTSLPLGDEAEVILVVEDEPAVRQFSVDALGELGYRVLEADGATAALRLLEAHPEIVLMFTDVIMPDVNGRKLADEAVRQHPKLRVLFTTGYTRNAVVHNGVLDPDVELIGKPFTIEELAAKVRDVLDNPRKLA